MEIMEIVRTKDYQIFLACYFIKNNSTKSLKKDISGLMTRESKITKTPSFGENSARFQMAKSKAHKQTIPISCVTTHNIP